MPDVFYLILCASVVLGPIIALNLLARKWGPPPKGDAPPASSSMSRYTDLSLDNLAFKDSHGIGPFGRR